MSRGCGTPGRSGLVPAMMPHPAAAGSLFPVSRSRRRIGPDHAGPVSGSCRWRFWAAARTTRLWCLEVGQARPAVLDKIRLGDLCAWFEFHAGQRAGCRFRRSWSRCCASTSPGPARDRMGACSAASTATPIQPSTWWRVWQKARAIALTPAQAATPLLRRPYDLRHSGVTWRLNSGVPPTEVAAWAGHSVEVLMRVYAKCMTGLEDVWITRMNQALHLQDSGPGGEHDGDDPA